SSLPSITGALSNRGMRTGWAFSGGSTIPGLAACFAADAASFGEPDGLAEADGWAKAAIEVSANMIRSRSTFFMKTFSQPHEGEFSLTIKKTLLVALSELTKTDSYYFRD